MVVVSYSGKEINAKLVYYGCGLSGKTTNLESIYEAVPDTSRGKMVSMKTQSDRTLFFDLLPLDLGEIMGFKTRFLLYTVPGQVFYNATRKLVLKGADAIVFVADTEVGKMEENKESLANLRANLSEYGLSLDNIPWVIQHNKRDLPNVYSLDEVNAELNPGGKIPFFEAVAKDGKGVFETFRGISHLLMEKVTRDLRRGSGQAAARPVPAEVSPESRAEAARASHAAAAPVPPAQAMAREAQETPAFASRAVDYGREIQLPGDAAASPHVVPVSSPAPVTAENGPVAAAPPAPAPSKPVEVTPVASTAAVTRRPEQVPVTATPTRVASAPSPVPSHASAGPAAEPVAPRVEPAAVPGAGVRSVPPRAPEAAQLASSPAAPGLAPRVESEELIVPIKLGVKGTHEIVLRIVLKIED